MIAVRANVSHAENNVGGELLLNLEAPGLNGGSLQVGLNAAGNYFCRGVGGIGRDVRERDVFDGIDGC
jgi:hypothetical protein